MSIPVRSPSTMVPRQPSLSTSTRAEPCQKVERVLCGLRCILRMRHSGFTKMILEYTKHIDFSGKNGSSFDKNEKYMGY